MQVVRRVVPHDSPFDFEYTRISEFVTSGSAFYSVLLLSLLHHNQTVL